MRTTCILEDVRKESLRFYQEIVGLAFDQICKVVIAERADRRAEATTINQLKILLAGLATGGSAHLLQSL